MLTDNFIDNILIQSTVELSDGTSADCDSISVGTGGFVVWFYDASKDSVKQSGILLTTWTSSGTVADLVFLAANDVGDSSDLVMSVVSESGNIILRATSVNTWTIKYKRILVQ
jgi:hypothetical protein